MPVSPAPIQSPLNQRGSLSQEQDSGRLTLPWIQWLNTLTGAVNNSSASVVINSPYILVTDFGAVADGVECTGSVTFGSTALTISGATASAGDIGKVIVVVGAGVGGENLYTTIAAVPAPASITLSAAASSTVSGALVVFGTDSYTAIQACFDDHPEAAIFFPEGIYLSSQTIILSQDSPARYFKGQIHGTGREGSKIYFTNYGTSADTDADMQHGFGAYNRVNDPADPASEIAGISGVLITGLGLIGPDYGASVFFGNSNRCIVDQCAMDSYQGISATVLNRHFVIIDCGINMTVQNCSFGSSLVAQIGWLKTNDTATGHVVYTTFPPYSGYFNDSHIATGNAHNGSCVICIADSGTGSFTQRLISTSIAGGGTKSVFYAVSGGAAAYLYNNWTEACTWGIGEIDWTSGGNFPGSSLPISYLQSGFGQPEQIVCVNNEFANVTYGLYLQMSANVTVSHSRVNNGAANGAFVYKTGASGYVNYEPNNLIIGGAASFLANRSVYDYVFLIPSRPTITKLSIALSGGQWTRNGSNFSAAIASTAQNLYIFQFLGKGVVTRWWAKVTTPFSGGGVTAASLLTCSFTGGDQFFSRASYPVTGAAADTNLFEVEGAPSIASFGADAIGVLMTSNVNWSTAGITGAFDLYLEMTLLP